MYRAAAVEVSAEKYVCVEWDKARLRRLQGIWESDIVVLFLPLSFYAKKKAAERKARISGGGAEDARVREHMAAPVPPLMYLPYDCSADSMSICLYPKRSASIKPPVSKRNVSRLLL